MGLLLFFTVQPRGGGGANTLISPSLDPPLLSPHPSRAGGVAPQHAHEGITQRGGEDSGHYTAHRPLIAQQRAFAPRPQNRPSSSDSRPLLYDN